jgi:hypothetical protein
MNFPKETRHTLETTYSSITEEGNQAVPSTPPPTKTGIFSAHTLEMNTHDHKNHQREGSFQQSAGSLSSGFDDEPVHLIDHVPDFHERSLHESSVTVVEPSPEEREPLLSARSSIPNYGTYPSEQVTDFSDQVNVDFSRPQHWDRNSIVEAQQFYETQSQHTSDPELRQRYRTLSFLLTKAIESQSALQNATRYKKGDERAACYNAFLSCRDAATCYQKGYDELARAYNYRALEFRSAASHFSEVASLVRPRETTGPLQVKIREGDGTTQQTQQYNLSEFSFEQEGSMREYYQIIASPNIMSGSDLQTIQRQKSLIQAAFAQLARARDNPLLDHQSIVNFAAGVLWGSA